MARVIRDDVCPVEVISEANLTFPQPTSFILAGKSGSGKTHFLLEFLKNHRSLGHDQSYQKAFICYREEQAGLYTRIAEYMTNPGSEVHMFQGQIPEDLYDRLDPKVSNLVLIDDLYTEGFNSNTVKQLFISGRHRNATVIMTTQNIFPAGTKHARTISLNANYIVLFRTRDLSQLGILSRQALGESRKGFLEAAFLDATKPRGGYLLLDLSAAQSNDALRVRTNVLSGDVRDLVVYQPAG